MTPRPLLDALVLSAILGLLGLGVPGCSTAPPRESTDAERGGAASTPGELRLEPVESEELEHLLRVSEAIWSGGEPRGDGAFRALAALGVRVVVSVDGARPDVETARRHGLRYVHVPIGYDGIPAEAAGAFTRLAREAEGPLYIHCHHGEHRGPAAAAIACLAAGDATRAEALRLLEVAGTSPAYEGLWRDVAAYRPPPDGAELPELVETAQVSSLVAAMAAVDRAYDQLRSCRRSGWATPADHPDLTPEQAALLLREGFHESARTLPADAPRELAAGLSRSEERARALEAALEAGDLDRADQHLEALSAACRSCHAQFRHGGRAAPRG